MSKYKLSPSELEFMEFFWNSTDEKCKQDVLDFFGSSGRDRSTVSFFLSKLSYILDRAPHTIMYNENDGQPPSLNTFNRLKPCFGPIWPEESASLCSLC